MVAASMGSRNLTVTTDQTGEPLAFAEGWFFLQDSGYAGRWNRQATNRDMSSYVAISNRRTGMK
jgi:hypothetical protein